MSRLRRGGADPSERTRRGFDHIWLLQGLQVIAANTAQYV